MKSFISALAVVVLTISLTACGLFKSGSPTSPTASDASITFQVIGSPLNGVLGTATITYSTPTGTVVATAVALTNGTPFVSPTAFSYGQFADIVPSISATVNGCVVVQILSNAKVVATSDVQGQNCGMPANRSITYKQQPNMRGTYRWLSFILVFIAVLVIGVSAQEVIDPSAVPVSDAPRLTSIAGVIGVAIFLTKIVTAKLGNHPKLSRIPTWCYVLGFSLAGTFLGNMVFHTLPGNILTLTWSAVYNGTSASGFYEWWNNSAKPLAATARNNP